MATEKDKTRIEIDVREARCRELYAMLLHSLPIDYEQIRKLREFINVLWEAARADAIEECAQLTDEMRYSCRDWPVEHECDYFGCGDLEELAKALRSLSRKQEEPR